ncbi:unnamed protein product [Ectocarpus sp. 12 AP-2014]
MNSTSEVGSTLTVRRGILGTCSPYLKLQVGLEDKLALLKTDRLLEGRKPTHTTVTTTRTDGDRKALRRRNNVSPQKKKRRSRSCIVRYLSQCVLLSNPTGQIHRCVLLYMCPSKRELGTTFSNQLFTNDTRLKSVFFEVLQRLRHFLRGVIRHREGGHMTNSLSGVFQANTDNPAASILPDTSSSTAPRSACFAGPCPLPRRRCSHRQRCCQPLPTREAEAAAVTPPPPSRHKHGLPGGSALHVLRASDPTACSQEPMMTSRPLAKPCLRAILAAGGLCFARPLGKRRARWRRRRRRRQFCQELRR